MSDKLNSMGIDPFYLFFILFVMMAVLIVMFAVLYGKYCRLQKSYKVFMRGENGKDLESAIFSKFDKLDELTEITVENSEQIKQIYKKMEGHYQKLGIVKYDAFHEMGGNLSFAIAMLDENDNGWILNAMHSREGCYTYIKEIIKGESYIELAEEERQCLEKAVFQNELI